MLKIGIAGVGGLGTWHLKTLLKMQDKVRVVALADPIPERASGEKLNATNNLGLGEGESTEVGEIKSYDDYSGVCSDPDVDIVVIATPSDLHPPAAIAALENGNHVFTEKPMGLSKEDCQKMIDASNSSGKKLMVGQCLRFFPTYVKAKEIMDSGKYGKPIAALMNRTGGTPGSGWFREIERSGGVNLDLHIHDIDAALWWWGKPDNIITKTVGSLPDATSVLSRWEYNNGLVAQIEATWDAGIPFFASFRIIMEQATLRTKDGKLELITRGNVEEVRLEGAEGHAAEMHYFIDCVMNDKPVSRCLPDDSALSVAYALGV